MAVLYITEHPNVQPRHGHDQVLDVPPIASQTVAIGGTSAQSDAFDAKTQIVQIHTDAICSIAFGADPTAAATNMRMAAGETRTYRVQPGDKVAVITNT